MSHRILTLIAALLFCSGCQKTTPSPAPAASPSVTASPAASAAAPADPTLVATLLGKPIYRDDCLSRSSGIGSAEVGLQRLILMALMDNFCQREVAVPSQAECDAFWETWQSAAERSAGKKPPVPAFDEAKIQSQLDETRAKLASDKLPWLERLQLDGQERSLTFALQHKTVTAHEAYNQLMPLRCQQALYEKYGGKVVGMQISIEPIGAYQKLIEEAEATGQLKFHDAALEQSFRNRMNDYAQRTEVPPEFVDFSLPMWLQISLTQPPQPDATASEQPTTAGTATQVDATANRRNDPDMLSRFVGVWQTQGTDKPAKWKPDGGESTVHEVTQWALKNRIVLGREHDQTGGRKSLWVMTHDEQNNVYPFWVFDSRGLMGGQWQLTWDAAAQTASGRATDTPAGWSSHGTNHFSDDKTNNVHYWMKDDAGALLMEANAKKSRQPDETGAAYLAAWSKSDRQDALPAELKLLDRLIGTWDIASTRKPTQGSTGEVRSTGTITREWILDGRFVMGTMEMSDGSEGLALFSFDPGAKEYRNWFFNSLGHRYASHGQWNEQNQTLSLTAMDDGRTTRISIRFENADREVWHTSITDAVGKALVDMHATMTRRATAPKADGEAP